MREAFTPSPDDEFGLWTVGNRGRNPFGFGIVDPDAHVDRQAIPMPRYGRSRDHTP